MPVFKTTLLMAALAGCSTVASAESLLPDYLRQTTEAKLVYPVSAAFGLTATADEAEPTRYLAEATAAEPGRASAQPGTSLPSGRWSPTLEPRAAGGQDAPSTLIEALDALGPIGVSVADYLALALPGLGASHASGSGQPPVDAVKTRDTSLPAQTAAWMRSVKAIQAAPTGAAPPGPWTLSQAVSDSLTRYLVGAAVLAILAGVGLRLALLTRRNDPPSLIRL